MNKGSVIGVYEVIIQRDEYRDLFDDLNHNVNRHPTSYHK